MLERASRLDAESSERGDLFGLAISLLNVAGAFKTTGIDRTPLADAAVLKEGPLRIMEVGVSDGTAALRLLERARSTGAEVLLTDRFPVLYRNRIMPGVTMFHDTEGRAMGMKVAFLWIVLFGKQAHDVRHMDAN
jgi:hypothetical protein